MIIRTKYWCYFLWSKLEEIYDIWLYKGKQKRQFDNNSFEEQEQKILERYPGAVINKEQFAV